jgi:hypothetical protein
MNKKILVPLAYALAVVFLVIAIVYFVTPADHLPHFMPGYSHSMTTPHIKHGLASLVLAVGLAILGWFAGGPKASAHEKQGS